MVYSAAVAVLDNIIKKDSTLNLFLYSLQSVIFIYMWVINQRKNYIFPLNKKKTSLWNLSYSSLNLIRQQQQQKKMFVAKEKYWSNYDVWWWYTKIK